MKIDRFVTGSYMENTYLLSCDTSNKAVVLDPGIRAYEYMRQLLSEGLEVEAIFLTHPHIDHVMGLEEVKKQTGAPIYMHRADVALLANPKDDSGEVFGYEMNPPPPADFFWEDNDQLSFGDMKFTVLHTPGHTPGSVCLLTGGNLFTGDTLFAGRTGKTNNPADHAQLMSSIRNKLWLLPDETKIFAGHYMPSTIGKEKLANLEIY